MKRHSKLKGTVLFTVISVMSLLIIFLTSTLVLATSASNRSHKNYSASQAEYTARAAIDSFSQAMVRNVAIAQSVVNLNSSNPTLNPTVEIVSSDMGKVGYYDEDGNLEENKIRVEYVGDTYVYSENKWVAQQVLKITATAVVGGEESTVTAYMRKKAPDEPKPLSIKGFQTLGGGGYTTTSGYISGAISMGITDEPANRTYDLSNASEYNTDMFFVNGNLDISGDNIMIDATKTNSASIIMGDLNIENGFVIDVNYPYATRENANAGTPWKYELTQKDIPYLYVDGTIKPNTQEDGSLKEVKILDVKTTGIDTATSKSTNAPYNIFCGHLNTTNGISVKGDIYIMGNKSGAKGESNFGYNDTNELYAWTSSVINKTKTQFYSEGGNIYSKDNLRLRKAHIKGDVRVDGDVFFGNSDDKEYNEIGVVIDGDLVVSGTIRKGNGTEFDFNNATDKDILVKSVKGNIYNGAVSMSLNGIDSGFHARNNIYNEANNVKPGYSRVQNFEYSSVILENKCYPNIARKNFVEDVTIADIQTTYNLPYTQSDFQSESPFREVVVIPKNGDWNNWVDITNNSKIYNDIEIIDNLGNVRTINDITAFWDGSVNQNVKVFYEASGKYFMSEPYVETYIDSETNETKQRITHKESQSKLVMSNGTVLDYVPENITIYKANFEGNKTDEVTNKIETLYQADISGENALNIETDEPVVLYKVDKDGNIILDEDGNGKVVSEYFTYYKPDSFGNATDEETPDRSFRYKADSNGLPKTDDYGNPINAYDDLYTYYNEAGSEVPESEAISNTAFYTKWYSPNDVTSDEVSYYDVDPDAPPAEASPVNDAEGNYTPQYQNWIRSHEVPLSSVTRTTNILKYDDYSGGAYPASMTREAIRGESEGGKYKIVSTLDDIKESIGCSSTNTFDENTYYKEVPNANIVGGKYVGFDYLKVEGGNTYNISKNTVISTGINAISDKDVIININPSGNTLWIVLDNCNFGKKAHRIVVSGNGIVNFFVKGTFNFDGEGIFTKTIWDQIEAGGDVIIREDDRLNINYYGEEGSSFKLGNNVLLCGIAKCPYSSISIGANGYNKNFKYIDKTGKVIKFYKDNPIAARKNGANWIGNALFKEMGSSANNFRLLYTGSSDDASNDIVNATLDTTWTVMYYDTY